MTMVLRKPNRSKASSTGPEKWADIGECRGSGTILPITWYLLVKALRENKMPYFDVYDSVTSSVIFPLSCQSVANKNKLVEVPDFTKGKWKTRAPLSFNA